MDNLFILVGLGAFMSVVFVIVMAVFMLNPTIRKEIINDWKRG